MHRESPFFIYASPGKLKRKVERSAENKKNGNINNCLKYSHQNMHFQRDGQPMWATVTPAGPQTSVMGTHMQITAVLPPRTWSYITGVGTCYQINTQVAPQVTYNDGNDDAKKNVRSQGQVRHLLTAYHAF